MSLRSFLTSTPLDRAHIRAEERSGIQRLSLKARMPDDWIDRSLETRAAEIRQSLSGVKRIQRPMPRSKVKDTLRAWLGFRGPAR